MGYVEGEKKLREAEVERLRSILRRLEVKEKLKDIKEKVWKEGMIGESVAYEKWTKGNVVELLLKTNFPDLSSVPTFRRDMTDVFYPGGKTIYTGDAYSDSSRVAILTVGVANVSSIEAVRKGNTVDGISETGDHIYVGFRTIDIVQWATKEVLGFSSFSGHNRKLRINSLAIGLEASQFIDERLKELTQNEFLPSNLRVLAQKERARRHIK